MASTHTLWQRLSFDGALCTVRFVGEVAGTTGLWLGVEWDDPSRGKHDGCHKGVRYFTCLSGSPTAASFVRPARPSDPAQTFVSAVREKYASEAADDADASGLIRGEKPKEIVISGKVAQEVGFDKVRRRLAQLHELRVVILDGARIASASSSGLNDKPITDTCPRITDLDLSRNLLSDWPAVVHICGQLQELRSLRLNGNRFRPLLDADSRLVSASHIFGHVAELALEETLLSWPEICTVCSWFGALTSLSCGLNRLSALPLPPPATLASSLTALNLEFNDFTSIADLASLTSLTSLRNLHLKGNKICVIRPDASTPVPAFGRSLRYLDVSYNYISSWSFVDALPDSFPGLVSLRLARNPVYDSATPASDFVAPPKSQLRSSTGAAKHALDEDPYMITIARLACLEQLNFSEITPAERRNAEIFYLSRIGRQLAAVPEGSEATVFAQHRRYAELCELYGEPAVVRQQDISQSFLEGRLLTIQFRVDPSGWHDEHARRTGEREAMPVKTEVPRSLDIYALKGIAGRLFGLSPLRLRLVWETGEWDPVAGFEEAGGGSEGEDDMGGPTNSEKNTGRLIRRRVELVDSPRQLGYCIDGSDANICVEDGRT